MWQIFVLSLLCVIETICGFCQDFGCTFNGTQYSLFDEIHIGCFVFQCSPAILLESHILESAEEAKPAAPANFWYLVYIEGSCPQCWISNDPHFKTFDDHYYDFHGLCNYTISQPVECCDVFSSYFPPYGIFGDFEACVPGLFGPKCLDITTYKITDDLWVQIKHAYPIPFLEINGQPLTVNSFPTSYYGCSSFASVMIWSSGECFYIVGTYYSIYICYDYMIVYTILENKVAGLCGFYSGTIDDEYRLRNCSYEVFGNEIPFGEDWKTIDQSDKGCKGCPSKIGFPIEPICENEEARNICEAVIYQALESCPSGYTEYDVSKVIENCIKDCCFTGLENCERWANVGYELLCTVSELSQITKGERKDE